MGLDSLVTYTAVIAVRYPELDNVQSGTICFGNYLLGVQSTNGGFLPIFWDAPSAFFFWLGAAWVKSRAERPSPDVEKERRVSFSRVISIFSGFPFQPYISDQFRSYEYADIRVYIYICAYLSRDVLHMLSFSLEETSQRA